MQRIVTVGLTLLLVLVTVLEAGARPKIESEEELGRRLEWIMCDFFEEGDFGAVLEILKERSKQHLGREVKLEDIYHHITCNTSFASNIDLIRMTAEDPIATKHSSRKLVFYFVRKAKRPDLLGKILMCRRSFGHGCLNVIEHINMKESAWKRNGNRATFERSQKFKLTVRPNLEANPGLR